MRKYVVRRSRADIQFKLGRYLRGQLRRALRDDGGKKYASVAKLLGCSIERFKSLMARKFRPGMTWENYGPVWHLDHVRPVVSFDLTDPVQQRACFRYQNYQPLFAKDNQKKSSHWKGKRFRRLKEDR